jgi:hypothetical protein
MRTPSVSNNPHEFTMEIGAFKEVADNQAMSLGKSDMAWRIKRNPRSLLPLCAIMIGVTNMFRQETAAAQQFLF